jgi:hypothetical protein
MARNAIVVVALAALAAAGCARAGHAMSVEPSASIGNTLADLAGHWQGSVWETGAHLVQGSAPVDLRLADDGTWRGTIGKMSASGTAAVRKGTLVLAGTATTHEGQSQPVYYMLKGGPNRRWGETETTFSGREGHGEVDLSKMPF